MIKLAIEMLIILLVQAEGAEKKELENTKNEEQAKNLEEEKFMLVVTEDHEVEWEVKYLN